MPNKQQEKKQARVLYNDAERIPFYKRCLSFLRTRLFCCNEMLQRKNKTHSQSTMEVQMINGVDIIKRFEGFRTKAYPDPATGGKPYTIGYGSTVYADGSAVKKGDEISQATAEALLTDYLIKNVRPHFEGLDLKECQKAALESLIYNIGWGAFSKSKCYKALKEKNWPTFIKEYDWFSGGGKFLMGLAKRRTEELALFFKDL